MDLYKPEATTASLAFACATTGVTPAADAATYALEAAAASPICL